MSKKALTYSKDSEEYSQLKEKIYNFADPEHRDYARYKNLESFVAFARKYEFFPIQRYNLYIIQNPDLRHGAIFDFMQTGCEKCKSPARDYYKFAFICNICGETTFVGENESKNTVVFAEHIIKHGITVRTSKWGGHITPAGAKFYQNIRNMVACDNEDHNACSAKKRKDCTNDVHCLICGESFMHQCNNIDNGVIKDHIEKCRGVIRLRTANNTLPANYGENAELPASGFVQPSQATEIGNKIYGQKIRHREFNNSPAKYLCEVEFCEYCGESLVGCKICNEKIYTEDIRRIVRNIIANHTLAGGNNCGDMISRRREEKYIFNSASVLHGKNRIEFEKIMHKIKNNDLTVFVGDSECIFCNCAVFSTSEDVLAGHFERCIKNI